MKFKEDIVLYIVMLLMIGLQLKMSMAYFVVLRITAAIEFFKAGVDLAKKLKRKEFAIEVSDEVSDSQAEEWAIDEVMYNLLGKYATGKEVVLRDEFVDTKLVYREEVKQYGTFNQNQKSERIHPRYI